MSKTETPIANKIESDWQASMTPYAQSWLDDIRQLELELTAEREKAVAARAEGFSAAREAAAEVVEQSSPLAGKHTVVEAIRALSAASAR